MSKYITPAYITSDKPRKVRSNLGLTQKEFAELIGVSKPTVERWETSDKKITGPVVLLSRLLDEAKSKTISFSFDEEIRNRVKHIIFYQMRKYQYLFEKGI